MKFAETCKAGGKWGIGKYRRKYLSIFIFISNTSTLDVKVLRTYN